MQNYVNSGSNIAVVADRDVLSGELYATGALVGYAQADAADGETFALVTEGVFRDQVAATADIAVGDVIYLAGQTLTTEPDDGGTEEYPRAGIATIGGTATAGFAEIHIKLNV